VLGARFNDARFFYRQDQKRSLDNFLESTRSIVFQQQLGTVFDQSVRLQHICAAMAPKISLSTENTPVLLTAAKYAKADLSSDLVSELSSLQGQIGGEYAKQAGIEMSACEAIANQYSNEWERWSNSPQHLQSTVPLVLADQFDLAVGFLGIGKIPSGSSDPNGIRRAVSRIVSAFMTCPGENLGSVIDWIAASVEAYRSQGIELSAVEVTKRFEDLVLARYATYDIDKEISAAALSQNSPSVSLNPREFLARTQHLEVAKQKPAQVQAATRAINMAVGAKKKKEEFISPIVEIAVEKLGGADGVALITALDEAKNYPVLDKLETVYVHIDAFFDNTMIMSQDSAERKHRLGLVIAVADALLQSGDLSMLQVG
jgi:glycyl-tRNA synthetase beta chain